MPAHTLDGLTAAAMLSENVRAEAGHLRALAGVTAGLAVVLVGDNPSSQVYVASKLRKALAAGISAEDYRLPATVSRAELLALIGRLNADTRVHGILVQLPLPDHICTAEVLSAIDPAKDVDGFHPVNVGLLTTGDKTQGFIPCTPLGCLFLLREWFASLSGLNALILGRSTIVGRPMAQLLLHENCTVTIAHSKTSDLVDHCRRADVLIAAVGKPNFVKGNWIKPGATVIDVGINRLPGEHGKMRLVGDVAFAEALNVAGAITPVPGGVGQMTVACLLVNTLRAARAIHGLPAPGV